MDFVKEGELGFRDLLIWDGAKIDGGYSLGKDGDRGVNDADHTVQR